MTAAPQITEETTFEVLQERNTEPSVTGNDEQTPETVTAPKENVQEKPEQVEAPTLQQEQSASHSSEAPQQVAEETETITKSLVIDIDESTTFQKSCYLYGLSKSDTSGYTEREKRAIRRNHVREAESLVNQYVDTHRYQDRVAAQQTQVQLSLVGSDLSKYTEKEKPYSNLDLFVVPEETDRSAVTKSIGGVTKTNRLTYHDDVKRPNIVINRNSGELTSSIHTNDLSINKEEVSLKELDFKLRKMLIKDYGLYQNDSNNGKIVIKIDDSDKDIMTLELNKKLQAHRMSDTMDVNKIQQITIDL